MQGLGCSLQPLHSVLHKQVHLKLVAGLLRVVREDHESQVLYLQHRIGKRDMTILRSYI